MDLDNTSSVAVMSKLEKLGSGMALLEVLGVIHDSVIIIIFGQ